MTRTWFGCLTIVAAFSSPLFAAAPATVLAPVPEAVLAVARTWRLEPSRDRVAFLPELIRLTQTTTEEPTRWSAPLHRAAASEVETGETAVVPLSPEIWSTAVFRRPVPLPQLLAAIVLDRNAALLAAGLATLDDETLSFVAETPLLLTELYQRGAAAFAAFAASLRVHDGQVVVPGGSGDVHLWAAVIGAPTTAPERFARLLFTSASGRLAYLYATVAALEPATQRFVLGASAPGADDGARRERMRGLATLASSMYGEWNLASNPYARPLSDLALLWLRLRVDGGGVPLPPADRGFWSEVWNRQGGTGAATATAGAVTRDRTPFDAVWLVEAVSRGNMFNRADRLDQLAFAQRVFAAAAPAARADLVHVIQAFPRQKMLMLTLERMGLRSPGLYAFVSRRAAALTPSDAARAHAVMAQLQPALAVVARMTMRGTLDAAASERLVRSLFSVPLEHDQYAGGVARWIDRELAPQLPAAGDLDSRVLRALAGAPPDRRAPRIDWEGERYRLDFAAAELRRLQAVRAKQGGPTIEFAAALESLAGRLASAPLDLDGVSQVIASIEALGTEHAPALASSATAADFVANGVAVPRAHRDALAHIQSEIQQALRVRDLRRAAKQSAPLREVVDLVLGQALLAVAYAADLGDPEGAALLSRNAALRHDFGVGRADSDMRSRLLWTIPRQDFQPGVAWHVTGSALGLDIALARLGLRRLNVDRVADRPRVSSIDREGFAVSHALLDVRRLRDETRDAIAVALARGVAAVTAAGARRASIDGVADRLQLSALRRRSLAVAAESNPARVPELLTLTELVQLGEGPAPADLAAWGVSGLALTGCPCTQVTMPRWWPLLMGRAQLPLAAAAIADLNIRVAAGLAELRLPAALAGPVLSVAIQDFLEDASPSDGGDWWGLATAARMLTRERIEDYVAAAAGIGGALILDDEESKEP